MPRQSSRLRIGPVDQLSQGKQWAGADWVCGHEVVQGSRDFTGVDQVLESCRYVVGRLHFRGTYQRKIHFPWKFYAQPNRKNLRVDRSTLPKRYIVYRVSPSRQHHRQHQHPQEKNIQLHVSHGFRGRFGSSQTSFSFQPCQSIHCCWGLGSSLCQRFPRFGGINRMQRTYQYFFIYTEISMDDNKKFSIREYR